VCASPFDGVLLVFFGALAVSTLVSGHPFEASGWARLWIVVAFYGVYWWLADVAGVERFVRWIVLAGLVAGAYGVLQHFTGADWYRALLGRERMVHPRIEGAEGFASVGFFRNYLTYAHVMLVPLGFALAGATAGSVLDLVTVGVVVAALVCSTARGAWIAAVVMAIALSLRARRGAGVIVAAALVVGAVVLVSPGLRQQVAPALGGYANDARVAIYRANLDVVHDHPLFGLGFGRYQHAATPYYDRHPDADRRSHAHSNYLQVAAEAGLVGLAAFMLLLVTGLREAAAAAAVPGGERAALGAWLGLVGFAVGGLTQYTFGDNEVALAMWATLAVVARLRVG
jgi:O-antigen ligase